MSTDAIDHRDWQSLLAGNDGQDSAKASRNHVRLDVINTAPHFAVLRNFNCHLTDRGADGDRDGAPGEAISKIRSVSYPTERRLMWD